jgi:anhydro-N-acetylmuramic acid kinase
VSAPALYIGLMSGTSLDGVDAAVVDFASERPRVLATHFLPYPDALRARLLALHDSGPDELHRAAVLSVELGRMYADAVNGVTAANGIKSHQIAAIGCHGQTVRHRPELGYTLQLGAPALLAELTGMTVTADFRSRDIAAGGQGAPLVPAFHAAMFTDHAHDRAIVNIGGIANLTHLPAGGRGEVGGFDTGPGNLLLDAWAVKHLGKPCDNGGAWAATGRVNETLLAAMQSDAYFAKAAPKSTGRDHFNLAWLESHALAGIAPEDVQATLAELTARSISDAVTTSGARQLWLCGGGTHNVHLVGRITAMLPACPTGSTAELGLDPDWVEAVAFAWLAKQTIEQKPGNLPAVTGARGLRVLGAVYPA